MYASALILTLNLHLPDNHRTVTGFPPLKVTALLCGEV